MSPEKIFSKQCFACATSSQKNSSYIRSSPKCLSPPRIASGASALHSQLSLIPFSSHSLTTFAALVVTGIRVHKHGHLELPPSQCGRRWCRTGSRTASAAAATCGRGRATRRLESHSPETASTQRGNRENRQKQVISASPCMQVLAPDAHGHPNACRPVLQRHAPCPMQLCRRPCCRGGRSSWLPGAARRGSRCAAFNGLDESRRQHLTERGKLQRPHHVRISNTPHRVAPNPSGRLRARHQATHHSLGRLFGAREPKKPLRVEPIIELEPAVSGGIGASGQASI